MRCPLKNSTVRLSHPVAPSLFEHRKPHRRRHISCERRRPPQQLTVSPQHQRSRGLVVRCSTDDSAHSRPESHLDAVHGQVRYTGTP